MDVQSVQSVASSAFSSAATGTNELGKDAFLQLLVTQLRYQDPLSPMENEAFLAQLAQFSSLEQMQEMNANLEDSMLLTQSLNNSAAAGLIGKNVRASGDEVTVEAGGTAKLGYVLGDAAQHVTVTVLDESGRVVRVLEATGQSNGSHSIDWDGRNIAGEAVPAGTYTFDVEATDSEGNPVPSVSWVEGRVDGVTFRGGSAFLLVGDREVPLSSVLDIYIPGVEDGDTTDSSEAGESGDSGTEGGNG